MATDLNRNGGARTALLTGATGYVGTWLTTSLLREGWNVHVLGRRAPNRKDIQAHSYDGTSASVSTAVKMARPDIVFHLASAIAVDHGLEQVTEIISANVTFPTLLLESMSLYGCSNFINTGTSWQHFDGSSAYNPANLYAATKQAFEDVARFYVDARQLNVITLKLFDVYGPDDPRSKLLPYLVQSALEGVEVVLSPGEQTIDLVHVRDVVTAFLAAAERLLSSQAGLEAFPVRSGCILSLRELADKVSSAAGVPLRVRWGGRAYRAREVMKPWSAMSCLPGWKPVVKLEVGLHEIVSNTRQHRLNNNEAITIKRVTN